MSPLMSLAEVQGWAFPFSAALFVVWPLVVLAWTICENWATGSRSDARRGNAEPKRGKQPPSSRVPLHTGVAFLVAHAASCIWSVVVMLVFAARLVVYALILLPWFLPVVYRYFFTPQRILRGIRFGSHARNYLDIYLPEKLLRPRSATDQEPVPVVIAVMGGAWIIGYRAWNALLAWRLSEAGALVVAVDYRNFPAVNMDGMVDDVDRGMDWVFTNIAAYGGDPTNVTLVGQSAGSHLSTLVLLKRCLAEAVSDKPHRSWSVGDLRGFVSVSGAYDLVALDQHLGRRGLWPILSSVCPDGDLATYSPSHMMQTKEWQDPLAAAALARLPPVHLFHGGADKSIPSEIMLRFAKLLKGAGARHVTADLRPGVGHAEPVIEDPFRGGDLQVEIILPFLYGKERAQRILQALPALTFRAPGPLVSAALRIMPF
jgi:prenylcysteine alpha-carboxyl methylesterase